MRPLLEDAAAQRAVFRIEVGEGSGERRYFIATEVTPGGIELEPKGMRLDSLRHWQGQNFSFRFILCSRESGRTQLFEFSSRVVSVAPRQGRLILALPDAVKSLERRQNVRITLHMRHMPRLGIWPVIGGGGSKAAPRIMSRPILDVSPSHSSIGLTIRNLSSGGMRLSLSKSDFASNEVHLEPGKRLLLELSFSGKAFDTRHLFRIISCVRNVMPGQGGRIEMGVHFLALHQEGKKPAWKSVEQGGVDQIGRLVHQFQVEYYKELKKRLERMPAQGPHKVSKAS
ncbi:hypothetical protein [Desulfolutivibrio sp.]|uniref:hypothetical protein n=1 Tax=Desulfolutivibrio sp. TaxID=2773296 RepID=UPI002F96345E